MSEYPLCEAVGRELVENRFGMEEYETPVVAALAAYDCNDGCLNEEFWHLEDLEQEIIRKFRYAIQAMLKVKGYVPSACRIVIEPCPEDTNQYMVLDATRRCILDSYCKAWNFGHTTGKPEELEEFFQGLLDEIEYL